MQSREKKLLAAVVALAVVLVAWYAAGRFAGMFTDRDARIANLSKEVGEKEAKLREAKRAKERLRELEHRALPSDLEQARAKYESWLLSIATKAKLSDVKVSAAQTPSRSKVYSKLGYTVDGKGTLPQLVMLLYEFYAANHLHQLRNLTVKPVEKSTQLTLSLGIEAVSLPNADRTQELNSEPAKRLAQKNLDAYEKIISKRNLFAEYVPPKPPEVAKTPDRPREPTFDPSQQAYLTSIVESNDQPQAWVHLRTANKTLHLFEGDTFDVGPVKGKILRIGDGQIEFEVNGKRLHLTLGKPLTEAKEMQAASL